MKSKINKILMPLYILALGVLFLVLSNINYISRLNAFGLLIIYQEAGFLEFLISSMAFLHLITIFSMFGLAIVGILNKFEIIEFKKSIPNFGFKKLEKVSITILASISAILLLLSIIFCSIHKVYIGVGVILNFVLEAIACVLVWILDEKNFFEPKQNEVEKEQEVENEEEQTEKLLQEDVETPTEQDLKE